MDFSIEHPTPDTAILRFSGRFNAAALDAAKNELLTDERLKYIIAEMSQTGFIDSLGLAALVSILKSMRQRGGEFLIVNPADVVRLLFELTRMDTAFHIVPNLETALQIAQKGDRGIVLVTLPPRLTVENATNTRMKIVGEIEKGARQLVLDASQTEFIDSSGLAVLVSTFKTMTEKRGKLAISGLQQNARQIFELTRMDIIFSLYPTLDDAQEALRA